LELKKGLDIILGSSSPSCESLAIAIANHSTLHHHTHTHIQSMICLHPLIASRCHVFACC